MRVEPDPAIVTKRLVLSRIARDDVDELVAMLLNPALYHYIGGAPASAAEAGDRACELAYLVDPPAQGDGFGTEMMSGFCAELHETMKPAEFIAHIYPGHAASEGVAKALGLVPTSDRVAGEQVWRAPA